MNRFADVLIDWYKENKRELPWRNTKDPYKIWVSEIILQQTRVAQGYDYYCRFVERFPDFRALAEADEDEVMRYWQGLGYYSRARNLHAAARSLAGTGRFPTGYEEVLRMKGVGEYTAAAICSFAYDMPCAVVDGNVYRVLSRWMGIDVPIDTSAGKRLFASLADELLDKSRPSLYNQAIMDFGALQCVPSSPSCLLCPLADSCVALRKGLVAVLPKKQHRTKMAERFFNYFHVHTGTSALLRKRVKGDIWQNLYEPPLVETGRDVSDNYVFSVPEFQPVLRNPNVENVRLVEKKVRYLLSHRIVFANCYEVFLKEGDDSFEEGGDFYREYQRVPVSELHKFPVSRLVSRFFSLLLTPNN